MNGLQSGAVNGAERGMETKRMDPGEVERLVASSCNLLKTEHLNIILAL